MSDKTKEVAANARKAKQERQKFRTSKNKEFRANRTAKRRIEVQSRRNVQGWEIVGDRSAGFYIRRIKDGSIVVIDDEPKSYKQFSDAYEACRAAGQPARMIQ